MNIVTHLADSPEGLVQKCSRCGKVLSDMTNVSGPTGWKPVFWPEGSVTVWEGNPTMTAVGTDPEAVPCNTKIN